MTTLANFGREVSSNSLAVSAFLVVLIVPFSVSSLFALFGNMKRAVIFMAMGFVSLIVAVAVGFYALDLWLYYGPK